MSILARLFLIGNGALVAYMFWLMLTPAREKFEEWRWNRRALHEGYTVIHYPGGGIVHTKEKV